ncbi:MAG TPA: T9SS type A sorting domain-containing protein [Rhodothermales bacterium]
MRLLDLCSLPFFRARSIAAALIVGALLCSAMPGRAQEVRVHLDSTAQIIRGFGAANIVNWRPDMTDLEIETAFGLDQGELGFSILRLRIPPDRNQWGINLRSARQAHDLGVTLIASPWSPPANMKTNNNLVGGRLRDDMYDEYAAYLNDFATYMAENDAPLYAISVQNEPDVNVTYESCDWSPEQMTRFMRENASAINTRVIAPESFQFRRSMSDPILNDSIAAANLDILGGHIYGGGLSAYPLAESKGKEVWMTEHLDTDTGWNAVLGTATEIQNVMRAGMNAYIWWYIVRFYGPIADGEQAPYAKGEVTKRGHMMWHFSRFIRPGAMRVHTTSTGLTGVSATAYVDGTNLVIVAINGSSRSADVHFTLEGGTRAYGTRYVTSQNQDAERFFDVAISDNAFDATLASGSVTTFVLNDTAPSDTGTITRPENELLQNYPNPFQGYTSIAFTLARPEDVRLEVFDAMGRRVGTLVNGHVSAGLHRVAFDAESLPSGVYFYRLLSGNSAQTRLMTLVR